jgi:hypothetical protein
MRRCDDGGGDAGWWLAGYCCGCMRVNGGVQRGSKQRVSCSGLVMSCLHVSWCMKQMWSVHVILFSLSLCVIYGVFISRMAVRTVSECWRGVAPQSSRGRASCIGR